MHKRLFFEIGLAALVIFSFFAPNVWQVRGQGAEPGVYTVAATLSRSPASLSHHRFHPPGGAEESRRPL